MKSLLPSTDEIQAVQKMRIYRTLLNTFKYNNVKTNIELVDEQTGKRTTASPNIYRIDDPKALGYMPSKIWHTDAEGFNLLFYTSPMMPDTARPFGNAPCYAFTLFVRDGTSVEYDWQTRIFIDQIPTNVGMAYMFIFAEVDAKSIMQTQWDGTPWEIERPCISADIVSFYDGSVAQSVTDTAVQITERLAQTTDPYLASIFRESDTFVCDASDMAQC